MKKAAVLHEVGQPLVIEDVTIDKPGPREVLRRRASVTATCISSKGSIHIVCRWCWVMNQQGLSSKWALTSPI